MTTHLTFTYSKLAIKTLKVGNMPKINNDVNDVVLVFIVNFEYIPHLFLVFPRLTLNKYMLAGKRGF